MLEKEIADLTKRIEDLTVKYDRLYEDRLDGLVSDKKFREMAERCEAEQSKAEARLAEVKESIENADQMVQGVEDFIRAAEYYEEIDELEQILD